MTVSKEELFRKVLAGDFLLRDVINDYEMVEQLKARDWVFSSQDRCMHSRFHPQVKSGGPEWQQDVIDSLRELGRI